MRTAFVLRHTVQEALRDGGFDATTSEWGLLNVLTHTDDQRVGDLAAVTRHDRTTITRVVDGLARRDLVERVRDPDDRRAVRVRLTREGRRLHRRLLPIVQGVLEAAFDGIGSRDRKALFATLARIHDNLLALGD